METSAVKAQRLLDEVHRLRASRVDVIPEGYHTVMEWAGMWKMRRTNAERILKELIEAKKMRSVRLRKVIKGRVTVVTFYG